MSPFYPLKAKERGLDVSQVGIVIGTMAIFQILSSAIVGRSLKKLGGRNLIIFIGTSLIIAQTSMLGMLDTVTDQQTFFVMSIVAQSLGGLGAGANATASMAILSSFP